MRLIARRGLFARKLRLALTALSIALGVTLISGTYVFTDTINGSFESLFGASYEQTDVVVTPDNELSTEVGPPPLPGELIERVRKIDGVQSAYGAIFWPGLIARRADGGKLKGRGFSAVNTELPTASGAIDYGSGRRPESADEVSILEATAKTEGLEVGDQLLLAGTTPARRYKISGVYTFAGVDSFGGGLIATFTLEEAQRVSGFGNAVSEIDIVAEDGVSDKELRNRVANELADLEKVNIRTGSQEAAAQLGQINDDFLGVIRIALLAFAGIALFVGAFLIFNTFSITVAQRTREFALLRVLGAKRGQVMRSVLTEGLILGVLGSLAGAGFGVLAAKGLKSMFKLFGADLPSTGTVVESRTIIVALVVGVVVTMISTIAPALRATRVAPLAALREGLDREKPPSHWNTVIGGVLTAGGIAAMAFGLFAGLDASPALIWLGIGAAGTFLGVALLSPRLVGPLAATVGAPLTRFGLPGKLAQQNAVRQPGRTAVTAAALMIGVALVVFASIFAAGIGKTIRDAVEGSFTGQVVIQADSGGGPSLPIAAAAAGKIAEIDGVSSVAPVRFARAKLGEETVSVVGVDREQFGSVYELGWKEGDGATLERLADDEILVGADFADANGVSVGDTLALETQRDAEAAFTVAGITDDEGGLVGDLTVSLDVMESRFGQRDDAFLMAAFDVPESGEAAVRKAIKTEMDKSFPGLLVESTEEFLDSQEQQINQLLSFIYVLLALSIIVSLFGIVNTLVLSIAERVRELGLLRAVGMSRRQIRRMIRYEAVITALIGATLGMVLGIVLAVLVTRAIDDFALAIPVGTLLVLLIASIVAGVLAAILPARRASRIDVLESLAYE